MKRKQEFTGTKILFKEQAYCLRVLSYGTGTPILIIPPHAGKSGNIAIPLAKVCAEQGRTVFIYELFPATQETKNVSIENLVEHVHECVQFIDEPVDLICLCQGTLAGAIYASIFPKNVNRYVNFAGTINAKTGCDNLIERYMKRPWVLEYHTYHVFINGGVQKGELQGAAFFMVDPVFAYIGRWNDLYNLKVNKDTKGIEKWNRDNGWLDTTQDIAGTWYLQDLEWIFRDNRLYNDTFPDIMGRQVRLSNITCDVYLLCGDGDPVTHHTQTFGMADKVSSKNIYKILLPKSGHTAAFTRPANLDIFVKNFFK